MSGSSTTELLSLLNANRIIFLLINVKPVLPTRLERQGNRSKAAETCRLLLVHWTPTGVCVFHYPSLVMDGVFNFCGTRFYFIIISFFHRRGKRCRCEEWGPFTRNNMRQFIYILIILFFI
jgi:hypothetical protein